MGHFLIVVLLGLQAVFQNDAWALNSDSKKKGASMSAVRTYMNYSESIDPAHILTMADLELSISLSSTLVMFDENRELVSGIAKVWKPVEGNKIEFSFRDNLKWSSGDKITADQYKQSLMRAKKMYPNDLRPLFDSIEKIESPNDLTLVITTKDKITTSEILLKLSEAMYGLVALDKSGNLDLSKSSGPFVVEKNTKDILSLRVNRHWYLYKEGMPEKIELKRPTPNSDILAGFSQDNWANLVTGNSIIKEEILNGFKKEGFKTWQRADDKLFALYPSKAFATKGGSEVIKLLSESKKATGLLTGLSGYSIAEQFFPRGYALWSSGGPKTEKAKIKKFNGAIKIIVPESYYAVPTKERLPQIVKEAIGTTKVTVEIVPLSKINDRMKAQDYDILATGIAVADPNFEGAVSFFIERDPPFIPSGPAPFDFAAQIKSARSLKSVKDRAEKMKDIIIHAQETGYVLPLFHFSSIAVAKPGVDISEIPNTDETVHFSKVRIK